MRFILVSVSLVLGLLSSTGAAAYDGYCRTAEDVELLPPRHWCEVPDSMLEDVEKKPQEFDDWNGSSSAQYESFQRVQGVDAVIRTWSGAAYDTSRECLLVWGGGHNDYGGNEIYRFCFGDLAWERFTEPTPFPNRYSEFQNPDGTPISRHTYGGLQYLPGPDRFFAYDGSPDYGPGACGIQGTWTFDIPAREAAGSYSPSQWELRTADNEPDDGCDNASAYDPVTGRVIFKSQRGTFEFDYGSARWTQESDDGRENERVALAVDVAERMLVEVGGGVTALWSIESNYSGGPVSTSGPSNVEDADDPGLVYDNSLQRIVGWRGGSTVYVLDTEAREWTAVTPAATNTTDPGSVESVGGVFGRFAYSPGLNVYIYVDAVDDNVLLYRLSDGDGISAPRPPTNMEAD